MNFAFVILHLYIFAFAVHLVCVINGRRFCCQKIHPSPPRKLSPLPSGKSSGGYGSCHPPRPVMGGDWGDDVQGSCKNNFQTTFISRCYELESPILLAECNDGGRYFFQAFFLHFFDALLQGLTFHPLAASHGPRG